MKKTLFLLLVLFGFFLSTSSEATAFVKGDRTDAVYTCFSYDAVIKLAELDAEDADAATLLATQMLQSGVCASPGYSFAVVVKDVILDYKDSKGVHTQLIEVVVPNKNSDKRAFVFLLPPTNGKKGSY
jgi:hypothetical protein